MNSRAFLLAALLSAVTGSLTAKPERPNILYFYADDWGWGAIGPNGQAERKAKGLPYVLTPNLDRLAAQGVNFTRAYGCTVCSPARSSQQTGFHQGHTFADRNDPNNAKKAIRKDDLTMGDMLLRAGYVTAYWGKWGYGGSKSQEAPTIDNVQTLPTSHGYQHVVAELHHVRAHTFFQPTLWNAPTERETIGQLALKPNSMSPYVGKKNYPNTPALQNHPDYPAVAYCDDVYSFAALDFVRHQAQEYNDKGTPFFALLAVQVPHAPFKEIEALPEWDIAYRDYPHWSKLSDQAKQWAAMVTRLDAHFGNVLAALDDPNGDGDKSDSVADNTLVVFQSDNGGPQHPARNEFAANGGLRANKGKIEEGGIRVPTIMRWPARINATSELKAGTNSDRVVDVTDLLPTFCELAGIDAPIGIDGVSIAPTLTGKGHQRQREYVIHEAGNGQSIIRGRHKLIRRKRGFELYDLVADHGEEQDISIEHPQLVAELKELLLGERVAEAKGFANTYRNWKGGRRGDFADPANWGDYRYANAGITYLTESGVPQSASIVRMGLERHSVDAAITTKDVDLLGLEMAGNQMLILDQGANLDVRNGIRLKKRSGLTLDGGTISSKRWIDIHAGSTLIGAGLVDATVFNQGAISNGGGSLKIESDLHAGETSAIGLVVNGSGPPLTISGTARLDGQLGAVFSEGERPKAGDTYTVLKAKRIVGRFRNDEIPARGNLKSALKIGYTKNSVTVTIQ